MLRGQPDMFWWLLLTSLLQQASRACASDGMDVAGAEGKSVTFHLQNLIGEYLTWSFRGEPILVIRLGASPVLVFADKSFTSRVAFSNNGSSLTISQLRRSDTGTYLAKSDELKVNFTLHVYSELSEPTVSCTGWNCSAENCSYALHCAVDPPGDSSFFWSYDEQPESEGPEWVVVVERQHPEDLDPLPYTCTAQNPVSSRSTTVFPSVLCAESTARIPAAGTFSSSHTVTIAGFVIGLLLLLAIIIIAIKLNGRRSHDLPVRAAPGAVTGKGAHGPFLESFVPSSREGSRAMRTSPKHEGLWGQEGASQGAEKSSSEVAVPHPEKEMSPCSTCPS